MLARRIRFLAHGTAAWASNRDVRSKITRKAGGSLSFSRDFQTGRRRRRVEDVGMLVEERCPLPSRRRFSVRLLHERVAAALPSIRKTLPIATAGVGGCLGPRNDVTFCTRQAFVCLHCIASTTPSHTHSCRIQTR